jgi:UDP-N-acetylglucosamine acyltransferase
MPDIHPTAVIHPSARLGEGVQIGPCVFIDAEVTIGADCHIMHGAHIGRWANLGRDNLVYPGAVIGQAPQDNGYKGEESFTVIGDGNIFREGVTVHRGNRPGSRTVIGNHNLFMVNSHVAHNCTIANHVTLVNGVLLAGHVEVNDRAIISGNCQVHQFVRIGTFAMMRGGSNTSKDIPPFCINDGTNWLRAINVVGMRRNGFDPARIRAVKEAFKWIFHSGLRLQTALETVGEKVKLTSDVCLMLDFIRTSKRGVSTKRKKSACREED